MSLRALYLVPLALLSLVACNDSATTATNATSAAVEEEEPGPTPAEWMDDACGAVKEWFTSSVAAGFGAIVDAAGDLLSKGPEALRQAVLEAVDLQIAAADVALDALDELGPGPTENGDDVLNVLRLAPQLVHDALSDVRIQIADLDLSDLGGAEAAFSAIESDLEAAGSAAEQAVSQLPEEVGGGYPPCLPA